MKPSELRTLLGQMIQARMNVLITGSPGLGKTDIGQQACNDVGADRIVSHVAVADPTDPKGLAWIAPGGTSATFLPFGEMARAMSATKLTVWDLEDFGQGPPAVQASFMQLLLARRVNGHVLPDCVTFIATTNRRTDRAGVSGILEPVKSRFATIVELEADINDWSTWAFSAGIAPELIAFLRFRPDTLSNFQPSADLVNSPSPRTWSHVSRLLALNLPEPILRASIIGAVGEGAAIEFLAFRALYKSLPTIDGILIDPDNAVIPKDPGTLYAVTTALGMRANQTTFTNLAKYATRMVDDGRGEFAVLLVRDALRKDPTVQHTAAFVRLASSDMGQLISGAY
jgi:hypothetical protein